MRPLLERLNDCQIEFGELNEMTCVKAHTRKTKKGKVIRVAPHERKLPRPTPVVKFSRSLSKVDHWEYDGDTVRLLDKAGRLIDTLDANCLVADCLTVQDFDFDDWELVGDKAFITLDGKDVDEIELDPLVEGWLEDNV